MFIKEPKDQLNSSVQSQQAFAMSNNIQYGVSIRALTHALARCAIARGAKVRTGGASRLRVCAHARCYDSD